MLSLFYFVMPSCEEESQVLCCVFIADNENTSFPFLNMHVCMYVPRYIYTNILKHVYLPIVRVFGCWSKKRMEQYWAKEFGQKEYDAKINSGDFFLFLHMNLYTSSAWTFILRFDL